MNLLRELTGYMNPGDIGKYYDDVDRIDTSFQQNTGQQMFDPNSQYNQRILQNMGNSLLDQMGMNYNMSQRQSAAGQGFGANQRLAQSNAGMGNQMWQGYNQHLGQAAQIGTGLLGQAMQGNEANQNLQLQQAGAMATQASQNKMGVANLWQGLLGAGLGGGLNMLGSLGGSMVGADGNNWLKGLMGMNN